MPNQSKLDQSTHMSILAIPRKCITIFWRDFLLKLWQYEFIALIVDTHRLVSDLESKFGYSKKQAEGFTFALKEINLDHVATKADVASEIDRLRAEIFKWTVPLLIGQVALFTGITSAIIG